MDLQAFVDAYHGLTLKQINLAAMLGELTALLRQHHLFLPADLALLFKSFITLEGMGRSLDGDFNMVEEALPLLKAAVRARYRPQALARRSWRAIDEALSLIAGLPQDLARLIRAARRGVPRSSSGRRIRPRALPAVLAVAGRLRRLRRHRSPPMRALRRSAGGGPARP